MQQKMCNTPHRLGNFHIFSTINSWNILIAGHLLKPQSWDFPPQNEAVAAFSISFQITEKRITSFCGNVASMFPCHN